MIAQGLRAALWWLAVEAVFRWGIGGGLMFFLWPTTVTDPPGEAFLLDWLVLAGALLILLWSFRRRMRVEGVGTQAIGYHITRRLLCLGLLAGIGLALATEATYLLDNLLSGGELERFAERLIQGMRELPRFTLPLLLLANGLFAPVVEEYAWRGYIQTRLTQGWGPLWGLLVTAFLFTAKHVIVEYSFVRSLTLLTIALALGLTRHFWGTGASTVTHLALNSYASWQAIGLALKP